MEYTSIEEMSRLMRRVGVGLVGVALLALTVKWWIRPAILLLIPVGILGTVAVLAALLLPKGYFRGEGTR